MSFKDKYQWIKGDEEFIIEDYDRDDSDFVYFKSGRKIFKKVINEFLVGFDADQESPYDPMGGAVKNVIKTPPRPTLDKSYLPQKKEDPISIILDSNKKTLSKTITIELDIEIPDKDVYELLCSMYSIEDVNKIIIDGLKSQINKINLKDKFGDEELKNAYKSNNIKIRTLEV